MFVAISTWVVILLAVGYATYAVTDNDGPLHIFRHMRKTIVKIALWLTQRGWTRLASLVESFEDLMDCYVCLSVWMALFIIRLHTGEWLVIESLAVAGAYVAIRKLFMVYSAGAEVS